MSASWCALSSVVRPAKLGVTNPQRRYTEKRPFESWDQLHGLAAVLGPRYGPLVAFAAATGLRPAEWLALEQRDIEPLRRVYDLRHTFATFALRAGVSTFDLSRYMGTSLAMIDRHYGRLARDGREHAIRLLDTFASSARPTEVHAVDVAWTRRTSSVASVSNEKIPVSRPKNEAL